MESMKFVFDEEYYEFTSSEFLRVSGYKVEGKDVIVKYMRSFGKCAYTTAFVTDLVTGNVIAGLIDDCYTDGIYTWYESDMYHFEKYDLKLNDEFINYVLSKYA